MDGWIESPPPPDSPGSGPDVPRGTPQLATAPRDVSGGADGPHHRPSMSHQAAVRYARCAARPSRIPRDAVALTSLLSSRRSPHTHRSPHAAIAIIPIALVPSRPAPLAAVAADAVPSDAGTSTMPSEYAQQLRSPAPPHHTHWIHTATHRRCECGFDPRASQAASSMALGYTQQSKGCC